ncbi:hypothetical protein [Pseudomonas sp. MWU12-2323]|uniref:hypothetical protein n=1 Tax=Pseudomonas sp. MWU12-2323 TaxID=2651296 RepID=UPI00128B3FB0|nr:hypothetical protein [Pseudomonas sp. MWU12-2323]MPQ69383.1 hypothetical protein [Pseudomonas sp. MWU12-2323]
MTTDAPIPADRVKTVKTAFAAATLFVLYVIKNCYDIAGTQFAASFALAAVGFLLIAAGLLFKFKRAVETFAVIGLIAGIAGFTLFKPTDSIPHDPNIRHEFTSKGGTVKPATDKPCTWVNGAQGQVYICALIVEPEKMAAPKTQPAS